MVTVLQLNRRELKDMLLQEIAENPVLEETAESGEDWRHAATGTVWPRRWFTIIFNCWKGSTCPNCPGRWAGP
jgi:DNA-directed RNA polymerase specialized sigma54-like protein